MLKTILNTKGLAAGYGSGPKLKEVLSGLDLDLKQGELTCLLGPNGSGKSTLIRTLTGIQKALNGEVAIGGKAVRDYTQKELARKVSMVLTDRQAPGNLTAFALVSLGRFPYTGWMGTLTQADKKLIRWAMEVTGTVPFANRHIGELSDGERQKVMIARALVQDTDLIILDEPTAHLDLPNRMEIFHLLLELAHSSGKAILLSTHEMDMALTHADRLWLVHQQSISAGVPEDLVLAGMLEAAFTRERLTFDYEAGGFKASRKSDLPAIHVTGPAALQKWTRNALERKGYPIEPGAQLHVIAKGTRQAATWELAGASTTYQNIEELLISIDSKNEENN